MSRSTLSNRSLNDRSKKQQTATLRGYEDVAQRRWAAMAAERPPTRTKAEERALIEEFVRERAARRGGPDVRR